MTLKGEEIQAKAPDVLAKAKARRGVQNPFITLQSLETQCKGNEALEFCLRAMVISSLQYAETVCRFEQIIARGQQSNEDDERKEIESLRTAVHDATMDSINLLARSLKNVGKDNGWILDLKAGQRAAYAKFAILIAFEVVLQERSE